MSFESHMPDHLKILQQQRRNKVYELMGLQHDCDCEYCDREGSVNEEDDEMYDQVKEEIKEIDDTIESLKHHARLHKIEL